MDLLNEDIAEAEFGKISKVSGPGNFLILMESINDRVDLLQL